MNCNHCGHVFEAIAPRFCTNCGAPTVAAPAENPPTGTPASQRATWIAIGLWVAGFLLAGGPAFELLSLLWLAAIPLLVLDALNPAFWAQAPAWARRPGLGGYVSALALLTVIVPGGLSFGWLLLCGGTYLFVKDSLARGEGSDWFDPRLLWRDWRRWMVIGTVLASLTFAAAWEPYTYVYGYSYTTRSGNWEYRHSIPGSSYGNGSAMQIGANTVPGLLMTAAIGWAMWRGAVPNWIRYLPLALLPVLVVVAARYMGKPAWLETAKGAAFGHEAYGPYWFLILLIPYLIGAVQIARGKD